MTKIQTAYFLHVLPTQPYLRLREQIQQTFDFAYVVCQSVPCLKLQMSLVKKGVIADLPAPDYFSKANHLTLISDQVKNYKVELSRHAILSSFSYFEAYVVDVVKELIDFHDGSEKFHARAIDRVHRALTAQSHKHVGLKRPLQKNEAKNAGRIRIATKSLEARQYVFPSELFYPLGIKFLAQKVGNLKASEIPNFIKDSFGMEVSDEIVEQFHEIRDVRNKIAHGHKIDISIKDVSTMNSLLRDFALEIDRHLMNNFFLTEKYR